DVGEAQLLDEVLGVEAQEPELDVALLAEAELDRVRRVRDGDVLDAGGREQASGERDGADAGAGGQLEGWLGHGRCAGKMEQLEHGDADDDLDRVAACGYGEAELVGVT